MCSPKGKSRAKGTGHDPAEKGGKGERSIGAQQAVAGLWRRSAHQDTETFAQPQSEREAVLTDREPSQAMGAICENRRG